jgi:L-threonylcarbamoyladenylate synthase
MSQNISPDIVEQIDRGISILTGGGAVAYPTDTVYGLGASALLAWAVERIYQIKRRPLNMPLPLLLANASQIDSVAKDVPDIAWQLIKRFMPGSLTLVLPKADWLPGIITGGGETVAVRIPNHPIPIALINGLGAPIVGTSANLSGQPSPLTADDVHTQLGDSVDLIIDGGRCPGGKESTIVDVSGERPAIIREGAISKEEIEQVCGSTLLEEGS